MITPWETVRAAIRSRIRQLKASGQWHITASWVFISPIASRTCAVRPLSVEDVIGELEFLIEEIDRLEAEAS